MAAAPAAASAQTHTGSAEAPALERASATGGETGKANEPAGDKADMPARLVVGSWGGGYAKSQEIAFAAPFGKRFGVEVKIVRHDAVYETLKALRGDQPPPWDIVDIDAQTLQRACREGLLEKISLAGLKAAGSSATAEDFLDGALQECGTASVAWSALIIYDGRAFSKRKPASPSDFFDVRSFPGKRALPRKIEYLLPLALMADGIAPGDVYAHLESPTGLDHAIAMLDKIGDHILWWKRGRDPLRMLADKRAAMALAYNGRVFHSLVRENRPFGMIWSGQIYNLDYWAVPAGTPNKAAALKFIAFASEPEQLAVQTRWLPYGPLRKSALRRIAAHAETGTDMAPFVPTTPDKLAHALFNDVNWWEAHRSRIEPRMRDWFEANAKRLAALREKAEAEAKAKEAKKKKKRKR